MDGVVTELAVGRMFGGIFSIIFSRSAVLMFVWALVPWLSARTALREFHVWWAGYPAGIGAILIMLAFACSPRPGRMRLALLEGFLLWCMLYMVLAAGHLVANVIHAGLIAGIVGRSKWIGIGMAAFALGGLAQWRIDAGLEGEAT